MNSFDLIPDIEKLETLFILESPYRNEVVNSIPCSGVTGIRMAQVILSISESKSFGELLNENNESIKMFGVMNTFPFPLEMPERLTTNQRYYTCLKNLKWNNGRHDFYNQHLSVLENCSELENISGFKSRLFDYIVNSEKLKNVVICGYIAQSVFLKLIKSKIPDYNKPFILNGRTGRKLSVIFTNHPSDRNNKWDFKMSDLT